MGLSKKDQVKNAARVFWSKQQYFRLSILIISLLIIVGLFLIRDRLGDLETYKDYGYVGAFLINVLASATVIFPVPAVLVTFALGGIKPLNPLLLGLVAGFGAGLGELTGYMAGYGSQGLVENNKIYSRLENWMRRRGSLTIVVLAFIPNFFFDVAGFAAGALRFPLWKFLIMCWLGKIPRFIGIAFAGAWSLSWVIDLIQRLGLGIAL